MLTYDAIYTRQSVDRVDSISVESQVEFCKREVVGNNYKVYTDKGYSGKNIDRPQFQELLSDIKEGKVRKVIVYRLDRISRSVLDFANIIDIFQKHRVDFVSTMEKFDTGTPIGKAMLMIVMIFAQLERETIQQRVIDAYNSRSLRGFYMGGRIPLGFKLQETSIDGIRTKMYGKVPSEADTVRLICQMYSLPHISFGDIVKYLDDNNIRKRDGRAFTRGSIRDIVINPDIEYVRTEVIEPIRIVEFPNMDVDGEIAPEEIEKKLPQVIDPSKLLHSTGKADLNQAVQDVMQQLADGTLTHQQYVDSISVPSDIVVPDSTVPGDDDDDVVSSPDVPEMLPYALNLTDFFPFCIPFDIYDFFSALIATPEAPQFHWEIQDLSGRSYSIDIDLSCWDSLAATFRSMQLALFIVGLAVASRKFIKW